MNFGLDKMNPMANSTPAAATPSVNGANLRCRGSCFQPSAPSSTHPMRVAMPKPNVATPSTAKPVDALLSEIDLHESSPILLQPTPPSNPIDALRRSEPARLPDHHDEVAKASKINSAASAAKAAFPFWEFILYAITGGQLDTPRVNNSQRKTADGRRHSHHVEGRSRRIGTHK